MAAGGRFEIKVKGTSQIALPAERATLRIAIQLTGPEKQSVSTEVVSSARKLESLLRQLSPSAATGTGAPIDHWTRTSLSESKHVPCDQQTHKNLPPQYTSKVDFEARFQKFHAIGDFITSVTGIPHSETQAVQWVLQNDTKEAHRSSLRSQAAKIAHQKALDYATALGYNKVVPLLLHEGRIVDTPTNRKSAPIQNSESSSTSRKNLAEYSEAWEEVEEPTFRYTPEDIEMSLSIEASFQALEN